MDQGDGAALTVYPAPGKNVLGYWVPVIILFFIFLLALAARRMMMPLSYFYYYTIAPEAAVVYLR